MIGLGLTAINASIRGITTSSSDRRTRIMNIFLEDNLKSLLKLSLKKEPKGLSNKRILLAQTLKSFILCSRKRKNILMVCFNNYVRMRL
jgi:hypothetical protein